MTDLTPDYDTRWKEIITDLFPDFLAYFLPEIFKEVDFSKGFVFLDKELHKLIADKFKKGKVINDKLVKVWLKDGTEKWILIHIEVQSSFETNFSERMFVYFYRIFDKKSKWITAIAVYTSDTIPKSYNKFEYDFFGTKATYEFNTYCVRDAKEDELIQSNNPFALAVLASKYLNATRDRHQQRLEYKLKLIKLLLERNYSNEQIRQLFDFINLMLLLPTTFEEKYKIKVMETYVQPKKKKQLYEIEEFRNRASELFFGMSIKEFEEHLIEEKIKVQKIEFAKFLLNEKLLPIERIAEGTGLSIEQIKEIEQSIKEEK